MVIRTPSGVVHQVAGCEECLLTWEYYKTAGKLARQHTKQTGHTTWVETGTTYYYKEQNNGNSNATKG